MKTYHSQAQIGPKYFFSRKMIETILMHLLTTVIVQNLKKENTYSRSRVTAPHNFWHEMARCPKLEFFFEKVTIYL